MGVVVVLTQALSMKLVLVFTFILCSTCFLAVAEEAPEDRSRESVTHTCREGICRRVIPIYPGVVGKMYSDFWSPRYSRCTTVFKMRGSCQALRIVCPIFNVPKGPNRKFTIDRNKSTNGDRPIVDGSDRKWMRVVYSGKYLYKLSCKVRCDT